MLEIVYNYCSELGCGNGGEIGEELIDDVYW